jgi:protein TonB
LGFTASLVLLLALSQSFKVPVKKGSVVLEIPEAVKLTQVELPKEAEQPKEKETAKTVQQKDASTASYSKPEIVKDHLANNNMSDVKKIDTSLIGGIESNGKRMDTEVGVSVDPPQEGNGHKTQPVVEEEAPAGPIVFAENMPEFPGGKEALIRFLQKNLQQPNDFEEGQKVTVIASFVVDKDGSITGINITQHGRNDLDNEVVRVIKKMPRWKPGLQNGRSVAVYYKVPVTFVSTE